MLNQTFYTDSMGQSQVCKKPENNPRDEDQYISIDELIASVCWSSPEWTQLSR